MQLSVKSSCIRLVKYIITSFNFLPFQGQFCDYCNAADPHKAHPVENAIDGTERWWQSPSLSLGLKYDEVNVTLDLGQVRMDVNFYDVDINSVLCLQTEGGPLFVLGRLSFDAVYHFD